MTKLEAIERRHSVRTYLDRPLEPEVISRIQEEIEQCNRESGLHIQLVTKEPKAFGGFIAHYGKFSGVTNYLALVGTKGADLEELCGYYGERLVIVLQQLGLNTCWVALTYQKVPSAFTICPGEKLTAVIALGYGKNQGTPHVSKPMENVTDVVEPAPRWFRNGVSAALLAPTALNQQKFTLCCDGTDVTAKAGAGFYTKIDLGIVKYHFEVGAGRENFRWAGGNAPGGDCIPGKKGV